MCNLHRADWLNRQLRVPQGATILDVSSKNPDTIYHYTDFAGLSGILEHRNLWATDMKYLNDAREIDFVLKEVIEMFQEVGLEMPDPTQEELDACYPDGKAPDFSMPLDLKMPTKFAILGSVDIVKKMSKPGSEVLPQPWRWGNGYVTCFTTRGDSLGQWRGYSGGDGFAIGFKRSALSNLTTPIWDFSRGAIINRSGTDGWFEAPATPPLPVVYGRKRVPELLDELREQLRKDLERRGPVMNLLEAASAYSNAALRCSAIVKAAAFKSEREWRVLLLHTGTSPNIKFRRGIKAAGGVTPYVELPFPDDAVAEIIIGPGTAPDLRERAVWQMVASLGYNPSKVKVKHSKISYRE